MLPGYIRARVGKCSCLKEALVTLSLAERVCTARELVYLGLNLWRVPVQVKVTVQQILDYGLNGLPVIQKDGREKEKDKNKTKGGWVGVLDTEEDRNLFPVKAHPGALTKVNVFFRDIWKDAKNEFKEATTWLDGNHAVMEGMYNDQASAWLMWFCACWEYSPEVAVAVITRWSDVGWLKETSDRVKSLGATRTQLGRLVTELKTMQCRGATELDRDGDVKGRIDKDYFESYKSCGIKEEIRPYVRQVLQEEMAKNPEWMGKDEYWSRRWLYTKAGSHARRIEDIKLGGRIDLPERPTRREFAENVEENMVAFGPPAVHAGQSEKLENGATRAIYSGDSVSYFTFDYLLRPIEAVWSNSSCLLDPGAHVQSQFYSGLAANMDVNLMIDFEDYNSQHTKEAMKVVIEEACAGAPQDIVDWALASVDNEIVYWTSNAGERLSARTVGSLFSGHRATTFINTVLNSAYIRFVCNQRQLNVRSFHAGDDVYLSGSPNEVGYVLERVLDSNVRVNKSKQGVGTLVGEFLRVAFTEKGAGGYLARAISSVVSGNWSTEAKLGDASALTNYAGQCWTLYVRSGLRALPRILGRTVERRVPGLVQHARSIVDLRLSVNGTPVIDTPGSSYQVLRVWDARAESCAGGVGMKSLATDVFLDKHVNDLLLKEAGLSREELRSKMLEVSYKPRTVPSDEGPVVGEYYVVSVPSRSLFNTVAVRNVNVRKSTRDESDIAKLLGRLVNRVDWEAVVRAVVGDRSVLADKLDPDSWPISNNGTLSLSELGGYRQRMMRPLCVIGDYPVFV